MACVRRDCPNCIASTVLSVLSVSLVYVAVLIVADVARSPQQRLGVKTYLKDLSPSSAHYFSLWVSLTDMLFTGPKSPKATVGIATAAHVGDPHDGSLRTA